MRIVLSFLAAGAACCATPAMADHILNLDTPYASRGACESAVAQFATGDRESLLERFPNFFTRNGDVASFLARAFPCEYEPTEQSWYIRDRRGEVLASPWFLRKP